MGISRQGRFSLPARMNDQFGLNQNVEADITPTARGLLIQEKSEAQHPVERVYGILDGICDVDGYLEEIRGR